MEKRRRSSPGVPFESRTARLHVPSLSSVALPSDFILSELSFLTLSSPCDTGPDRFGLSKSPFFLDVS